MHKRYALHKVITAIVAAWFLLLFSCVAVPWYQARRPKGMPKNSIWIDAPHVPFGFYRGWWQGCWKDKDRTVTRCKLWGSGVGTVYVGEYVPCDAQPILEKELILEPRSEMWWTTSEKMSGLVPVVLLQDGRTLVPKDTLDVCAKLKVNPQP
jgi:hypothetical protein